MLRLEGIHSRVTKIIKITKTYSYRERVEKFDLTSLQHRKIRGDLMKKNQLNF